MSRLVDILRGRIGSVRWGGQEPLSGVSIGAASEVARVELRPRGLPEIVVDAARPFVGELVGPWDVRAAALGGGGRPVWHDDDTEPVLELELWAGVLALPDRRAPMRYEESGAMDAGGVADGGTAWVSVPFAGRRTFLGSLALDAGDAGLDVQIFGAVHHGAADERDLYQLYPETEGESESIAAGGSLALSGEAIGADELVVVTDRTGADDASQELRLWLEVADR